MSQIIREQRKHDKVRYWLYLRHQLKSEITYSDGVAK